MEEAPVAVPGVRSGLGHDGDLPAGGFTELRLVVGGKNFYFFDGVRIDGYVSAAVVAGVYVGSAVQGELVLIGPSAIDIHGVQPARSGSVPVETAGHSRDQLHVIQNVPAVHRHVVELFAAYQVGSFAGVGLQLNLSFVGRNCDAVHRSAYLQHKFSGAHVVRHINN